MTEIVHVTVSIKSIDLLASICYSTRIILHFQMFYLYTLNMVLPKIVHCLRHSTFNVELTPLKQSNK